MSTLKKLIKLQGRLTFVESTLDRLLDEVRDICEAAIEIEEQIEDQEKTEDPRVTTD